MKSVTLVCSIAAECPKQHIPANLPVINIIKITTELPRLLFLLHSDVCHCLADTKVQHLIIKAKMFQWLAYYSELQGNRSWISNPSKFLTLFMILFMICRYQKHTRKQCDITTGHNDSHYCNYLWQNQLLYIKTRRTGNKPVI